MKGVPLQKNPRVLLSLLLLQSSWRLLMYCYWELDVWMWDWTTMMMMVMSTKSVGCEVGMVVGFS